MNAEILAQFATDLEHRFQENDATVTSKTAEQDNVSYTKAMYQAVSQGDYDAFCNALDKDVEMEFAGHPASPIVGRWKGREAVCAATAANFALLEDQRPIVHNVIAQGDCVAIIASESGRVRATGREYSCPWLHLFTWQKGKIIRNYSALPRA